MNTFGKTALVGLGALFAGWVAWGVYASRTAEPVPYDELGGIDGVQFRQYPAVVLAETTAPDQRTAFRRLYRYISGANDGDESIGMTAPVQTSRGDVTAPETSADSGDAMSMTAPVRTGQTDDGQVRMGFYLPAEYDAETAPAPTESTVTVRTEPEQTVAVRRFSWFAPQWRVGRQEQKLLETLDDAGLDTEGDPSLLRYNDPWTPPFMRRNEVAVPVETVTDGERVDIAVR